MKTNLRNERHIKFRNKKLTQINGNYKEKKNLAENIKFRWCCGLLKIEPSEKKKTNHRQIAAIKM